MTVIFRRGIVAHKAIRRFEESIMAKVLVCCSSTTETE